MMIQSNTQYDWRVDIIRKHVKIGECKVSSCSIDFVEDAEVTRTMKATIPEDGFDVKKVLIRRNDEKIYFDGTRCFDGTWCFSSAVGAWDELDNGFDMFSDRLRPVLIIDGVEQNFGDYMVIAAPLTRDGKKPMYEIEAYDETMILKESALTERKYYAAGTKYLTIINYLLTECGFSKVLEEDSDATITVDHEYPIGTSYLDIINELLDEIGYAHIYSGADGYVFLRNKVTKSTADYIYSDKNSSLTSEVTTDTDIYTLPNVVVGYVSSPDIPTVLRFKKVNDNMKSVISTVRRGYNVVESFELNDCPDIQTLQKAVEQRFFDSAQATEKAQITTMPDGNHPYGSYISLGFDDTNTLFREVGWSIEFGGTMLHNLERKTFV